MAETKAQRAVFLQLPEKQPINIEFKDITYTVSMGFRKGLNYLFIKKKIYL